MIGTKHEMNALKKSRLANRMPTGAPRMTKKRLPNACADAELLLGLEFADPPGPVPVIDERRLDVRASGPTPGGPSRCRARRRSPAACARGRSCGGSRPARRLSSARGPFLDALLVRGVVLVGIGMTSSRPSMMTTSSLLPPLLISDPSRKTWASPLSRSNLIRAFLAWTVRSNRSAAGRVLGPVLEDGVEHGPALDVDVADHDQERPVAVVELALDLQGLVEGVLEVLEDGRAWRCGSSAGSARGSGRTGRR